jgi:hypothetical protein
VRVESDKAPPTAVVPPARIAAASDSDAAIPKTIPVPPCHSERSEESNSAPGLGVFLAHPTPCVILSAAKNP